MELYVEKMCSLGCSLEEGLERRLIVRFKSQTEYLKESGALIEIVRVIQTQRPFDATSIKVGCMRGGWLNSCTH